jgi:hypothetical protein
MTYFTYIERSRFSIGIVESSFDLDRRASVRLKIYQVSFSDRYTKSNVKVNSSSIRVCYFVEVKSSHRVCKSGYF